jgi:hypothetical protein
MSAMAHRGHVAAGAALALASLMAPAAGARTVADVVRTLGPAARERLRPSFDAARVAYPPRAVTLLALKEERRVEVWARGPSGPSRSVVSYPILAASGGAGPKLREGDRQVPEGAYRVLWLNPASSYHLSMKVDYPNAHDVRQARAEGRTALGGDIFIHGRDVSIGCIALGDPAIEELFVLASDVGLPRVAVLIAPRDFRRRPPDAGDRGHAPWVADLYRTLHAEMAALGTR